MISTLFDLEELGLTSHRSIDRVNESQAREGGAAIEILVQCRSLTDDQAHHGVAGKGHSHRICSLLLLVSRFA